MSWYRLAGRLGKCLDEVKAGTSMSQFVGWMMFMEWELNHPEKLDYYLSQIAAGLENLLQVQYKAPKYAATKDKLIKFVREEPSAATEESVQERTSRMKQFFHAIVSAGKRRTTKGRS